MSVVVGLIDGNRIILGADRQATGWNTKHTGAASKIFTCGDIVLGGVGSCGSLNIVQTLFVPPDRYVREDTEKYLAGRCVPDLRKLLKEHGKVWDDDGIQTWDSLILVALDGRLFLIETDFGYFEHVDKYAATGSGEEFALGSLHTTMGNKKMPPKTRVRLALEAAAKWNTYVGPPFDYLEVSWQ